MKNEEFTAVHRVYLGLGSNLGDRRVLLDTAVRLVSERVGPVVRRSSYVETAPWGFQSDHRFLNAVILCQTTLTPREVLRITQQIERDMGRRKKSAYSSSPVSSTPRYTDRPIDIDILLYDDLTVDEPDLRIPHPLMTRRDFVMIPLREITSTKILT